MLLTRVHPVCVLLLSLVFIVVGSGSVNGQDRSSGDDGSVQAETAVPEDTDGQDSGGFKAYEEVITDNAVLMMACSPYIGLTVKCFTRFLQES